MLIGFSRLYLGAHWLSDVAAGLSLGFTWILLLAMVYTHHHVNDNVQPKHLGLLVIVTLRVFGPWTIAQRLTTDLVRYTPTSPPQTFTLEQWLDTGWRQLPWWRVEAGGDVEEPLPLQWADRAAIIRDRPSRAGWQAAPPWSAQSTLLWLTPDASVKELPVLPKYHKRFS